MGYISCPKPSADHASALNLLVNDHGCHQDKEAKYLSVNSSGIPACVYTALESRHPEYIESRAEFQDVSEWLAQQFTRDSNSIKLLSSAVVRQMSKMASSEQESRTSTPRSFTGQSVSAEEMLKSQTVGLVHLSDFRKRRAEVLEQKEREAHDKSLGRLASGNSRSATPSTGDVTDG